MSRDKRRAIVKHVVADVPNFPATPRSLHCSRPLLSPLMPLQSTVHSQQQQRPDPTTPCAPPPNNPLPS